MAVTFSVIFVGLDGRVYLGSTSSESVLRSYLDRCREEGWPMCLVLVKGANMLERPLLLLSRQTNGTYRERRW